MPDIDVFKDQNELDPVFMVDKNKSSKQSKRKHKKMKLTIESQEKEDSSDLESLSIASTVVQNTDEKATVNVLISQDSLTKSEEESEE
jgi:hypothetical protein